MKRIMYYDENGSSESFEHSINFNKVQDASIHRSSSVVMQKLIKSDLIIKGGWMSYM